MTTPFNNSKDKEALLGQYEQLVLEEDQLVSRQASYQELITMFLDLNLQGTGQQLDISVAEELLLYVNGKHYETNKSLLLVRFEKGRLANQLGKMQS